MQHFCVLYKNDTAKYGLPVMPIQARWFVDEACLTSASWLHVNGLRHWQTRRHADTYRHIPPTRKETCTSS